MGQFLSTRQHASDEEVEEFHAGCMMAIEHAFRGDFSISFQQIIGLLTQRIVYVKEEYKLALVRDVWKEIGIFYDRRKMYLQYRQDELRAALNADESRMGEPLFSMVAEVLFDQLALRDLERDINDCVPLMEKMLTGRRPRVDIGILQAVEYMLRYKPVI